MADADKGALGPLAHELLSLVADGVISTDESGLIILVNKAVERIFGHKAEELLGKKIEILLPDRLRASHQTQFQTFGSSSAETTRAMARGRNVLGLRKNGEEFPVEASLTLHDLDGRRVLTAVLRDISERRQIEEVQRLITTEISHRLKNLMMVVNSIVSLTGRGADSVKSYQEMLQDRLRAVGRTVELLLRSQWSGAELKDLLNSELAPFKDSLAGNFRLSGPEVQVPARWSISLTLALHELATNAAKYGALSTSTGIVMVTWQVDQAPNERVLQLSWVESGGPPVEPVERPGFGSDLIFRALGRSNSRFIYHPDGLEAHLQLPI